jgi:hypothetical protein
MWTVYENAEKHESKYGRITLPNSTFFGEEKRGRTFGRWEQIA